jgi:hypothetical protein
LLDTNMAGEQKLVHRTFLWVIYSVRMGTTMRDLAPCATSMSS